MCETKLFFKVAVNKAVAVIEEFHCRQINRSILGQWDSISNTGLKMCADNTLYLAEIFGRKNKVTRLEHVTKYFHLSKEWS